jgi:hypothetical protein
MRSLPRRSLPVPHQLLHQAADGSQPPRQPVAAAPRRLPPVALALSAHAAAWVLLLPLHAMLPAWAAPLAQGGLAAAFGQAFGLPRWWLPLNFLLVPAGHWLDSLALPPGLFLCVFLALALLFWTTYRTRVPLFLSSVEACEHLGSLLPRREGLRVIDLGCGLGGVLVRLAPAHRDVQFVGVEVAPLPAFIAWLRNRHAPNARVVRGDFWRESLAGYDVVYAFLSPAAMPALWSKARAEMNPGSLLISNSFPIPDADPERTLRLRGRGSSALYVWRL